MTEFAYNPITNRLDMVSSGVEGDVVGPASSTNNALARWDGTTGKLLKDSVAILTDAGVLSGVTQLNVDNLRLDGNTLSSTDANGNINLTPNGAGVIAGTQLTLTTALDEIYGGTGQTTYAQGDVLYASAANTLSKLTAGADGEVLTVVSGVPGWAPPSGGYDVSDFSGGKVYLQDNFFGVNGMLGWSTLTANAGATSTTTESGHIGILQLRRVTNANACVFYKLPANLIMPMAFKAGWYLKIATLPDGTNRFDTQMGYLNSATADANPTDGIYFRYVDDENSGKWTINTLKDSTPTQKDSGIAADTNWHYFEIESNAAGTSVSFYIDGVQTSNSPITTNIPVSTDTDGTLGMQLMGTDGTGTRTNFYDKFYFIENP